jgi:hypothetical protein
MELSINIKDENGKEIGVQIDNIKFQKMMFLYNALNDGWTVKKKDGSYIFKKNHEGKKEVFLDTYLTTFMKDNLDIQKLLIH